MKSNYNNVQFEYNYPCGLENYYWNHARNQILLKEIKKNKLENTGLLEIGCGKGIVIKFLKDNNIQSFGIELSQIETVAGLDHRDIVTGKDASLMDEIFKEKYKTLLLLDVIEHIDRPVDFVKNILENYKNINTIIITVPAKKNIWSNYDEFYKHFRRYDLEMMKETIQNIGFRNIESRYFFHLIYFIARIVLKLNRSREIKIKAPKGFNKFLHRMASLFFVLEYKLVPKKWSGSSIISVLIRNNECAE